MWGFFVLNRRHCPGPAILYMDFRRWHLVATCATLSVGVRDGDNIIIINNIKITATAVIVVAATKKTYTAKVFSPTGIAIQARMCFQSNTHTYTFHLNTNTMCLTFLDPFYMSIMMGQTHTHIGRDCEWYECAFNSIRPCPYVHVMLLFWLNMQSSIQQTIPNGRITTCVEIICPCLVPL